MEGYCNNAEIRIRNGHEYLYCKVTRNACACQRYCTTRRKIVHTDNVKNCKLYEECTKDKE